MVLTNELPRLADASGAMASRFLTLRIVPSFYGREDPGLAQRLMGELPGILNWAIEGWQRLHLRGHFVEPKASAEAAQQLADLGSPISAFVRDRCMMGPTADVEVDRIYSEWRLWCAAQGIDRPGAKHQFGRDLSAAFPEVAITQPRVEGRRLRVYQGIGLEPGTGGTGGTGTFAL